MNYSGKTEKRQKSINKTCYSEFEHALLLLALSSRTFVLKYYQQWLHCCVAYLKSQKQ